MGNIIKMPLKRNVISDEEINALFFGLIKLVKKQENEKLKFKFDEEIKSANEKLSVALSEIVNKEKQIESLKQRIKLLNHDENLKELEIKNRIKNLEKIQRKDAKATIGSFIKMKKNTLFNEKIV